MLKFRLSILALAAALAAAPLKAEPMASAPRASPAAAAISTAPGWWLALGDARLSALVSQALAANLDLAQAEARLRRSQALLAGADAAFGPSGTAVLSRPTAQASEAESPGRTRADRRSGSLSALLQFSWEADLFGRLDAQSQAASQRLRATQAELHGVRLALSAEVAHAWFALAGAREQRDIARAVIASRKETLRLVDARAADGLAAPIDALRAKAALESAAAQEPMHEAAIRVATHRLAVLTGQSPASYEAPASDAAPAMPVALPLPTGADWLARRPDIQAHEAELQARGLDVQAVRAEFYPRLSLSGVLGFVAGSASGLGAAGNVSWLGAPSLLAPIFDRPRIEARLAAAEAQQKEALHAYHQRLLLATEELENALARYGASQRQLEALQRGRLLALQAEQLARLRYRAGAADLLELLEAQRSAQEALAGLATAVMEHRQHLVAVQKGLGGGA